MNEKNLKPIRTESEAREKGRRGGIASGKARREKKTVQAILTEIMGKNAASVPRIAKLASEMGLQGDKSIKDVFAVVATINTLETANLGDLEKLAKLLGEETQFDDNNKSVEETLATIKECAYANRDKS